VDGQDQFEGAVSPGRFRTQDGITWMAGESSLYDGVQHRRLVLMLDARHVLVVDRLASSRWHTYQQMWHLFHGARVTTHGLDVTGTGATAAQSITISQLQPYGVRRSIVTGRLSPPAGLCSQAYLHAISCPQVAYTRGGRDAAFTTLLTIGPPTGSFSARYLPRARAIAIREGSRSLEVRLGLSAPGAQVAYATDPKPPRLRGVSRIAGTESWVVSGDATQVVLPGGATRMTTTAHSRATLTAVGAVAADLSTKNLMLRFRVRGADHLANLDVELSNDHWRTTAEMDLRDSYPARYEGEWLRLSLPRGQLRDDHGGHWVTSGTGAFDWSRVDGLRFVLETSDGTPPASLDVASVAEVPWQKRGVVLFVFDDGYASILPAASALHRAGMPGNVAVIGKYTVLPARLYLNTDELRTLQNAWGWNMVNHTQRHVDAIFSYRYPLRLDTYERDVVGGAVFLEEQGLNSAPNWLIYPHGTTDAALSRVVRRFYKFARTTDAAPDAYPFGNPLRVKTLEVKIPQDSGEGGDGGYTPPAVVQAAVLDAKRFHQTLILTFHRIHSRTSDRPGYPLRLFRQIVADVRRDGIEVTTFSGLDRLMGVREDNRIVYRPARPAQIVPTVVEARHAGRGLLGRVASWF
ncbi:MAG: heparinase II/III family protein, partial [Actinobacteria bacterium]|nr:heparinase II/III family protein [Actinomycetota bacterium]